MPIKVIQQSLDHLEGRINAEFEVDVTPDVDDGACVLLHGYVKDIGRRVGTFNEANFYGESWFAGKEDKKKPANRNVAIFHAGIYRVEEPLPTPIPTDVIEEGIRESFERVAKEQGKMVPKEYEFSLWLKLKQEEKSAEHTKYRLQFNARGDPARSRIAYETLDAKTIKITRPNP